MTDLESAAEVAKIIAEAAPLPLLDAAYALWRWRYRLDTLEGRPTAEDVEINRAMTSEQFAVKYRWERDHAQDGPAFNHLKRPSTRGRWRDQAGHHHGGEVRERLLRIFRGGRRRILA